MQQANDSGMSTSVWMDTASVPEHPPLTEHRHADVCVVGAGIAGITTAYLLTKEGKRVIVLDDGPIGGGESGRTTGHLASAQDDRFYELERLHGQEATRLIYQSHAAAIDMIERIVADEKIDCDFRRVDGYLFVRPGEDDDELQRELEASRRAGCTDATLVEPMLIDGLQIASAIRYRRQGQFHALKYISALACRIQKRGGEIFTATHVDDVDAGMDRVVVKTRRGFDVTADAVVVATNSPINDRFAIHLKQVPYRTYVVAAQIAGGTVPYGLYWDTLDPYHYIRLHRTHEGDMLIVGGGDHKPGESDALERITEIEAWMRMYFPTAGDVRYRWSGQVLEPVDGLAYIGRNPSNHGNVFIATGDSGQGLTHGTIAAMLLCDLIQGVDNPWSEIYSPSRISLGSVPTQAKAGADAVAQYGRFVTGGDVASVEQIEPGEGAIMRDGLTKVAVYRDPNGELHKRSAVCPHLGCLVSWNRFEKSWDCPCHGSRFDPYGRVLNGPAVRELKKVE